MTTELASPLHDKLGQELKPGVWIFYGHNIGTSAGLRLGKVMAVSQGEVNERCPWLSNDRVTVWGIDDDHLSYYKYHKDEPHSDWARPKPNSKKSTLLFSSRCVVVPEEYVPEPYRRMIEDKINETYEG